MRKILISILFCTTMHAGNTATTLQPSERQPEQQVAQPAVTVEQHQTVNFHMPSRPPEHNAHHYSFIPEVSPTRWINNTHSFVSIHKWTLLLAAITGTGGYIWYVLNKGNTLMQSGHSWSAWKHHLDFAQLCQAPQEQLAQELLSDIQRHYINYQNPTDFVAPLSRFAQDLQDEHILLSRYIKLGDLIVKCHTTFLFPINAELIEKAHNRIERINFVKHIFVSWSAHHNLQQNGALRRIIEKMKKTL